MKSPDQAILSKQENVSLQDLQKFISDLQVYNKEHHWGTMMGESVSSSLGGKIKEKTSPNEVVQQNRNFLIKTGLDIEPTDRKDVVMFSSLNQNNTGKSPSEMRINIANNSNFNRFLDSIDPNNIREKDIEALEFVTKSLTEQIRSEYDLENPEEDRLLNLFAGLEKIIKNYQRLDPKKENGLSESVKNLGKYLETSRSGYLKEYLIAETGNYLPMPDEYLGVWDKAGFSLSTWQGDSSPDSYENHYWQNAFNALDEIKKNPRAQELYHEILSYFKKCAIFGRKSIVKRNEEYPTYILKKLEEEAKDPNIHRSEKDPKILIEQMNSATKGLLRALDRIESKLDSYQ